MDTRLIMENPLTTTQLENDTAMRDFPLYADRREKGRYTLQNAVFLLTRPFVVKTATIRNISMGGLSYRCARSEHPPRGIFTVDLLTADLNHCFRLESLPVESVGDPVPVSIRIDSASGKRSLLMFDCRLQFREMLPYQRERLKFLIRNYALAVV
jgi:hypothetical protein